MQFATRDCDKDRSTPNKRPHARPQRQGKKNTHTLGTRGRQNRSPVRDGTGWWRKDWNAVAWHLHLLFQRFWPRFGRQNAMRGCRLPRPSAPCTQGASRAFVHPSVLGSFISRRLGFLVVESMMMMATQLPPARELLCFPLAIKLANELVTRPDARSATLMRLESALPRRIKSGTTYQGRFGSWQNLPP